MNTLAGLQAQPPPTEVALAGPRMDGTIPVRYRRASNWARTVTFGDTRFATDNHIRINGIDYTIAGLDVIEDGRHWTALSYSGFLRRTDSLMADGTDSARQAIKDWAVRTAGELAERHPAAFDANPHPDISATDWQEAHSHYAAAATICASYAAVHKAIAEGATTTTPNGTIGEICWNSPPTDPPYYSKLTARQPAPVVATVNIGTETIAYVVDVRSHGSSRPDPAGGLIVPLEQARTP